MSGSDPEVDGIPEPDDSSVKSSESSSETPEILPSAASSSGSTKSLQQTQTTAKDEDNREDKVERHTVIFVHKHDVEIRQEASLPTNTTVKSVKAELAKFLNLQKRNIRLIKDGRKMRNGEIVASPAYKVKQEQQSMSVVNVNAGTEEIVIEIGLDDSDSESEENDQKEEINDLASTVTIVPVRDVDKLTEVAVVKSMDSRQYLGGYRNKMTGRIYYHATSQTEYKNARLWSSRVPAVVLKTRETQTLLPLIEEGVNTTVEKCTQMAETAVYVPEITDKIVTARPYQPYEEKNKLMTPEAAARILQKAWKFFIQKKKLKETCLHEVEERTAKKQYKGSSLAEFHKLQLSLLTKDSFPSTRGDFYDLYTTLGEWKKDKLSKAKVQKSGFAYKVAVADLQQKELEGLLAIEQHRIQARNENLSKQDIMFLEGTARSRVRRYPKGNVTIIDDLNIQRARNFKEQFASYTRKDVTKAERIEILSCMKSFLGEFDAVDLTGDLIELIDREIDMITMGIEDKHMAILRKRFESLFINLAKNPEFNPQAKYYKGSSQNTQKFAKYKCISCGKVMYPSQMFMHLRMSRFRQCMSCAYMHTTATATTNLAPYKRLLLSLRAAEQEKCCRSAIPFLLQPMGMYFLVNVLWDGKSVISGSSYLPGLKVTRWLPNEEWSMWNMILLTEPEAHKHERLEDPLQYYSRDFILNVMNRNILGRMHFHSVADIDDKFRRRELKGILPKEHLLFTRRKDESLLPQNDPHPCLVPSEARFDSEKPLMKDACN